MERAGSSKEAPSPEYTIMARRGTGSSGRRIPLLANYFKVYVNHPDTMFYQYSASITTEDKREVNVKGVGRKLIEKLYQTYSSELRLSDKRFAYDGEKCFYTVGPLPQNKFEFTGNWKFWEL